MINGNSVVFLDGSKENIDIIVYCTGRYDSFDIVPIDLPMNSTSMIYLDFSSLLGYQYDYPFLDASSGITVEADGLIVKPLFKHYINIEEPTMCFIGLFQRTIISYLFDLQVPILPITSRIFLLHT